MHWREMVLDENIDNGLMPVYWSRTNSCQVTVVSLGNIITIYQVKLCGGMKLNKSW